MKKTIFLVIILSNFVWGYKQHVHQYISLQAYNLLKYQLGYDIRIMKDRVGGLDQYYVGPGPWQLGYITTGAWREDMEDVVYGYSNYHVPQGAGGDFFPALIKAMNENNEYYSSITHFWYADDGDNLNTTMTAGAHVFGVLSVQTFSMENAYQKLVAFKNGGYDLNIELILYGFPTQSNGSGSCATQRAIVTFHYNSLIDMYKNKNIYVTKVTWLTGQQTIYNSPIKFLQRHWSLLNSSTYNNFFDIVSFEILGRMCHLLQDMSVPAHVNIDPHGPDLQKLAWQDDALIPDYYEEYLGYDYYWDYLNTYSQAGGFINPYQSSNPLHFLMYTTNQMANHFATEGPHYRLNNNYFSGNPLPEELSYLNPLNVSQFGEPTSINSLFTNASILNVRDHMLPQAIRATAGLLYWFAKEAELLPIPLTSVTLCGDNTLYQGGTGNWYVTLGNGLEPFTYQWEIYYFSNSNLSATRTITPNVVVNGQWVNCGTNSPTFSRSFSASDLRSFKLRCTVKDGSSTTKVSNEFYVSVINAPPPQAGLVADNSKEIKTMKEGSDEILPVNYELQQNYPNPFNPSTKITYSLPKANSATLKVYDMLGREVATLVNELKSAGIHEVEFDASKLSSGTYIYKLTSGSYQSVKKMILTK